MTNWNKPELTDNYDDILTTLRDQLDHIGREEFTGDTNVPTGFLRTNDTSYKREIYTGSSWISTLRETEIDNHINNTSLHQSLPVGAVTQWLTASPPTNYFILDGSAKSRTTYAELFALWGTTFGAGDGTTTFGIPDMRERIPIGKGGSGSANVSLGSVFGAIDHVHTGPSHTHTTDTHTHDMANHTHNGASHTHTTPNHQHGVPGHYHSVTGNGATIAITSGGAHAHGLPTRNAVTGWSNTGDCLGKANQPWQGASAFDTLTGGAHGHSTDQFTGQVGNVDSGNNGDGTVNTTSSGGSTTGASGTGATSAPSTNTTGGSGTLTSNASGTGNTGTGNPPCIVVNWIVKAL